MIEIEKIHDSGILATDMATKFDAVKNDCIESMEHVQVFRTRTEMDVSVLNDLKFPTAAAKYWQAVREQSAMANELILLSFEYRKNIVDIKILEQKIENGEISSLQIELCRIDIEKKQYIQTVQRHNASARIAELVEWSEIKTMCKDNMSNAELSNPNNHQLISYTRRWIGQAIQSNDLGTLSERLNLFGQMYSGLKACLDAGVLDETIACFSEEVQEHIRRDITNGKIRKIE